MIHVPHEELPGYDARQIWHDGCPECEVRGEGVPATLTLLDNERFALAWKRAVDWMTSEDIGPVARAEVRLLQHFYYTQLLLQRAGIIREMGDMPCQYSKDVLHLLR